MTTATAKERTYSYEGLFLFPQSALADMQGAVDHIKEILHRAHAQLIALKKWDERRLAYEIKGNKRGLYFLAYFTAPASRMVGIERDCNLSEKMLRALITRADDLTADQMQAADGQAALADEIKLRRESPSAIPAKPAEDQRDALADDMEDGAEDVDISDL
ncbi:MAG TPA: 30S ribosomal protein S6 [Phycisphaerales bacterium]|nr:30S ribosomal protein S6 [Phycisphaerales bacterium]